MRYGMLIDNHRCIGCGACVVACKQTNGTTKGVYWCNVYTKETGIYPNAKINVLAAGCMHCENAPCVNACPTGASYHTEEGIVLVAADKCIGCRSCVNACPYNARHYNFADPAKKTHWEGFEMTPYEEVMSKKHPVGKTEKCTFCKPRLDEGKTPACVDTCVTKARIFGDSDDPNSQISKAIIARNAQPLYEHLGTKPSVYYVGKF